MYSEFKFIFDPVLGDNKLLIDNRGNEGDIYGKLPKSSGVYYKAGQSSKINNQKKVNDYLRDVIYDHEKDDYDPYLKLIKDFQTYSKALSISAADLAYLKELGVMPLNRLVILRRFPDGVVVPNNLLEWGENAVAPVSTVIGWVKEGSDELFSLNFSESWVAQTQTLDKVFAEILNKEFGLKADMFMSVPGWSQGFLWGFLNASGLASQTYSYKNVPVGDPNVLKTAMMRDIEGQGLKAGFKMTLETTYEQKFISGVDPSLAMVDIISNLTRMGTSNMNFYLRPNSGAITNLLAAVNSSEASFDAWVSFVTELVNAFFSGIKAAADKIADVASSVIAGATEQQPAATTPKKKGDSEPPKVKVDGVGTILKGAVDAAKTLVDVIQPALTALIAGTVMKYRWPIKGSIFMMTGLPSTPWHLTVGNPYSPVISLNNILVEDVSVSPGTEFGFGDMPVNIKATIGLSLGRPLGKQEIDMAFNNSYKRYYSIPTSSTPAAATDGKIGIDGKVKTPALGSTSVDKKETSALVKDLNNSTVISAINDEKSKVSVPNADAYSGNLMGPITMEQFNEKLFEDKVKFNVGDYDKNDLL